MILLRQVLFAKLDEGDTNYMLLKLKTLLHIYKEKKIFTLPLLSSTFLLMLFFRVYISNKILNIFFRERNENFVYKLGFFFFNYKCILYFSNNFRIYKIFPLILVIAKHIYTQGYLYFLNHYILRN